MFAAVAGILAISILGFLQVVDNFWPDDMTFYRLHLKTYERLNIDGGLEPEMPNWFKNYSTLEGVDINNNNVRDDVEIWINHTFPNDRNKRLAAKMYAKELQIEIKMNNQFDKLIERAKRQENPGFDCYNFIFYDEKLGLEQYKKITSQVSNTRDRYAFFRKIDHALSGSVFSGGASGRFSADKCDFKIDEAYQVFLKGIKSKPGEEFYESQRKYDPAYFKFIESYDSK